MLGVIMTKIERSGSMSAVNYRVRSIFVWSYEDERFLCRRSVIVAHIA